MKRSRHQQPQFGDGCANLAVSAVPGKSHSKDQVNKWIDDPDVKFERQSVLCGHLHDNADGWAMLECHVDTNEFIFEEASL